MAIELFENKDISVMCPICHRFLTKADSKDYRKHKMACKKCKRIIVFIPKEPWNTKTMPIPERDTSAGKRFY